jgi:hypothetical protein
MNQKQVALTEIATLQRDVAVNEFRAGSKEFTPEGRRLFRSRARVAARLLKEWERFLKTL